MTDFGTIKCKNAYAALFENDRLEIIPVPFIKPETIELDLSKIPFKNAQTLQKLDRHGKVISQEVLPVDNSETLQLNIDGSCFSYKIF